MKCPACEAEMVERRLGITIDVCIDGCRGIWFDPDELVVAKLSDQQEFEELQDHPQNRFRERGTLLCPRCQLPMRIRGHGDEPLVYVDECSACGGVFLDSGELALIREMRPRAIRGEQSIAEMMIRERLKSRRADERSCKIVEAVVEAILALPELIDW